MGSVGWAFVGGGVLVGFLVMVFLVSLYLSVQRRASAAGEDAASATAGKRAKSPKPEAITAQMLADGIPPCAQLDEPTRQRLAVLAQQFVRKRKIKATGDLQLTPSMFAVIAGSASLLCLDSNAKEEQIYPTLKEILVTTADSEGGLNPAPRSQLRLRWNDVLALVAEQPPRNVVVGAFARWLATESMHGLGPKWSVPKSDPAMVLGMDLKNVAGSASGLIDATKLTSKSDLFVAATEVYFQRGGLLAQEFPRLHALLREYFVIDTAALQPAPPQVSAASAPAPEPDADSRLKRILSRLGGSGGAVKGDRAA